MTFAPADLKRFALCSLELTAEQYRDAPAPRSMTLRFTLAYLFTVGDGTRWPFDGYWRVVTEPVDSNSDAGRIGRHANVQCNLNGIYLAVGIDRPYDWRKGPWVTVAKSATG